MRTSNTSLNEFNHSLQSQPKNLSIGSSLKKALKLVFQFFVNGNDLQIWITTDGQGNKTWHAYDPISDRSTSQSSEAEIRTWIEQRYYK